MHYSTSAIWQHAARTTNQLLLDAKQEPYKKAYFVTKSINFPEESNENVRLEKKTR